MHFLPALTAAAFLLPATAIAPAIAQPLYRCGNTYSQEACKGGKVVEEKSTTPNSGQSDNTVYLCKVHGGMAVLDSALDSMACTPQSVLPPSVSVYEIKNSQI